MKYRVFISIIALFVCSAFLSASNVEIIKSSSSELEFIYKPELTGVVTLEGNDGVTYVRPDFRNQDFDYRKPGAVAIGKHYLSIAVPSKNGFTLGKISSIGKNYIDGKIMPQPELDNLDDVAIEKYFAGEAYSDNVREEVELKYYGIATSNHIANVIIPNYSIENGKITYPDEIRVQIKFDTKSANIKSKKNISALPFLLNKNMANSWAITKGDLTLSGKKSEADLSSGNWLRVKITEEGLYSLTAKQLTDMGFDVNANLANTIKVLGNGGRMLSEYVSDGINNDYNEIPAIINKDGNGNFSSVVFYASGPTGFEYKKNKFQHYKSDFSDVAHYYVTWGGLPNVPAKQLETPAEAAENTPTSFTEKVFFEEELRNPFYRGSGRLWLGRSYFKTPFVTALPGLKREGEIEYTFALAHEASNTGYFTAYENDKEIGKYMVYSSNGNYNVANRTIQRSTIDASYVASDDRSSIRIEYENSNASSSTPYFDYFEIQYPRYFSAEDNSLGFDSDPYMEGVTEFTVNGFSGNVYGFDVSDKSHPQLLENISSTGSIFRFKTELQLSQAKRFYISGNIKATEPEKINLEGIRWKHEDADMIVITHPSLESSAKEYEQYRETTYNYLTGQNFKVQVVTLDDIYNEFAYGIKDITAIRDYVAHVYHERDYKPQYIFLWGDGHYDYQNRATSITNFVPPYEDDNNVVGSIDESDSYAFDDYYGCIVGEDRALDIAIGRAPINSNEEGRVVVEKIDHYENNSSEDMWRSKILIIADDGIKENNRAEGSFHVSQSESLHNNYIEDDFQVEKIYMVQYPVENIPGGRRKPQVTQDMLTEINNSGALFVNWVGHGNPRVWAHESIMVRETTIPQMVNKDKLFFLMAATCDYGRFDNPDVNSGAEDMFLSPHGSAIGVFAATRVVYASENAALAQYFYQQIQIRDENTHSYPSLGMAYRNTKAYKQDENSNKFFLMADPALKLKMPDYKVRIDSINGISADDEEIIKIKALENVRIAATILKPDMTVDNSFNGQAVITVRDGDDSLYFRDEESEDIFFFKLLGGALNRSSVEVRNGKFTSEIIIPKDISFSEYPGRIFAYAFDDDKNKFAKGENHNFIVDGVNATSVVDSEGPEITIYMDSKDFTAGEIVKDNPLLIVDLKDETGINTTGLGIGHRIEAWIDDNPDAINLTDNFTTELGSSREGTAQDVISGLRPGIHTVKVRAWDIYNNYSVEETYFRISESDGFEIGDVINYPNPIKDQTTFKFRHNGTPPVDVVINIFTIQGELVRTLHEEISESYYGNVPWDGLDSSGRELPSGTYIYTISINGSGMAPTLEAGYKCVIAR